MAKGTPPPNDSTQRGCTSWLLISCVVLTLTTSFVFGWGLGAPNMYNQYTEPFLKGNDACRTAAAAKTSSDQATTLAAPVVNNGDGNQRAIDENEEGIIDPGVDANGDYVEVPESAGSAKQAESFSFVTEVLKGIPQTVFLIGAFIGALTGPFWSKWFDRKRTVFANYIFCFASSLCVLLAYYFKQPWLFYLSRLLLGYQGKFIYFQ